jgi:hypothetical protein
MIPNQRKVTDEDKNQCVWTSVDRLLIFSNNQCDFFSFEYFWVAR